MPIVWKVGTAIIASGRGENLVSLLYVAEYEKSALKDLDTQELSDLVDEAVAYARPSSLHDLRLLSCGAYVSERLRRFERELANYAKAKATRKREETRYRAVSAGMELVRAVREMQGRVRKEEEELELYRIHDSFLPPRTLTDRLEVRVGYQWRASTDEDWNFGNITFVHNVDMRPDYLAPQPKRKPSAFKQEQQRQDELYRHWESLVTHSLLSVREYLNSGRDPVTIPETFEIPLDPHSRDLNTFSCRFWQDNSV